MQLIHTIFSDKPEKILYKILKDGYMKPSSITGNVALTGEPSKYIFMRIKQRGDTGHLYFNSSLLLECVFYLNVGWSAGVNKDSIRVDGTKLTKHELFAILKDYKHKVYEYYKKTNEELNDMGITAHIPIFHCGEILLESPVSIEKYLEEIRYMDINEKTQKILETKYPDVIIK